MRSGEQEDGPYPFVRDDHCDARPHGPTAHLERTLAPHESRVTDSNPLYVGQAVVRTRPHVAEDDPQVPSSHASSPPCTKACRAKEHSPYAPLAPSPDRPKGASSNCC